MDADVVAATVGLTIIINFSYALSGVRYLLSYYEFIDKFLSCSMCVGFWVGGILRYYDGHHDPYDVLLYAVIGSISSFTWYLLMKELMDKHG